jgi:hypothetical protein
MDAHWTSEEALKPPAASICHDEARDALVFAVDGTEVLVLSSSGYVEIQGRFCGNDEDAFKALNRFVSAVKEWMQLRNDCYGRLRSWCNQFGEELTPPMGRADSYGDGVRDCKAAVGRILARYE